MTTVEVYVSYCPTSAAYDMALRFGGNFTSPAVNNNLMAPSNSSSGRNSSSSTRETSLCNQCPNSVGICCPPTVQCDANDGKCPLYALENSGNTINGYLIAQVMNSTAPVAGRKKARARVRSDKHEDKHHRHGHDDREVDARIHSKKKKGRAHKKHF